MASIDEHNLFRQVRQTLKGEDDAIFMYGATRPDGEAMKQLSSEEAEEVHRLLNEVLDETEKHSKFLEAMLQEAEGTKGGKPLSPDRMRFLPQFEGIFKTEAKMLIEHLELYQQYLKIRGFDRWARGLQSIIRDEFKHVEQSRQLLIHAVLFDPEK